jgi:hypothetical protein
MVCRVYHYAVTPPLHLPYYLFKADRCFVLSACYLLDGMGVGLGPPPGGLPPGGLPPGGPPGGLPADGGLCDGGGR